MKRQSKKEMIAIAINSLLVWDRIKKEDLQRGDLEGYEKALRIYEDAIVRLNNLGIPFMNTRAKELKENAKSKYKEQNSINNNPEEQKNLLPA